MVALDRAKLTRVASALSVASLAAGLVLQLAYPRLLLSSWGDAGYAYVVAVQGFIAYVSVADAGLQAYLTLRISTLRAAGEGRAADAMTRAGLRAFALLATTGCIVVFAALLSTGRSIWHDLAVRSGSPAWLGIAAAAAQTVAGGFSLALGGWSTAVDYGRNRYVRVQLFGFARTVLVMLGIALLAVAGLRATTSLMAVAAATIGLETTRFLLAYRVEARSESVPATPARQLIREARGSILLAFGSATQVGLQPYVAAALSSSVVSVAVPGRTLANGARTVSSAIGSVVWVAVAARFAELKNDRERFRMWCRSAPVLATIQLTGILALLTLSPLVVPRWLPTKSPAILSLLPYYCVEQGAYVAIIPSTLLLNALGRFGLLGVATLAASASAVILTWYLIPLFGAAGFAGASAGVALLVLAPALTGLEWLHWRRCGVPAGKMLLIRTLAVAGACAAALLYVHVRLLGNVLLLILTVAMGLYALAVRRPLRADAT